MKTPWIKGSAALTAFRVFVFPQLVSGFDNGFDHFVDMLDFSWFSERVIMIDLLMGHQMIKYAKHLSDQSYDTNFRTSSRLDSQEEPNLPMRSSAYA